MKYYFSFQIMYLDYVESKIKILEMCLDKENSRRVCLQYEEGSE